MRRKWTIAGVLVLALAAIGGLAARLAMAGDAGVRTVALGSSGSPWAVAVDAATGRSFVVTHLTGASGFSAEGGSVSVVQTSTGKVVRTVPVGPDPRDVAVDARTGRAFVANDDNASVSVLDTHSGAVVRTTAVGPQPRAVALDPQTSRAFVVNTGDNTISVLDTHSGAVVRTIHREREDDSSSRYAAGAFGGGASPGAFTQGAGGGFAFGYFQQSAAVDTRTNRAFIGSVGSVTVLDARSGVQVASVPVSGYANHIVVDSQTGDVYVADDHGIDVLDGRSGRVLRTVSTGAPASAVGLDARRGRLFVAHPGTGEGSRASTGSGTVSVLDSHTGALLRTVPVGVAPSALAVDEQTGQAIVVNSGGLVQDRDGWSWVPSSLQRWVPFRKQQAPSTHWVAGSVSIVDGVQ